MGCTWIEKITLPVQRELIAAKSALWGLQQYCKQTLSYVGTLGFLSTSQLLSPVCILVICRAQFKLKPWKSLCPPHCLVSGRWVLLQRLVWEESLCLGGGGIPWPAHCESCQQRDYQATKIFETPGAAMKQEYWLVNAMKKLLDWKFHLFR